MVLSLRPEYAAALSEGLHSAGYIADVSYDGEPTFPDLPLAPTGSITVDASGRVQATGRLYVRSDYRFPDGRTLAPRALRDTLAPMGQEVDIRLAVALGSDNLGAVSLGRFRIRNVPTITETRRRLGASGNHYRTVALELEVADRFDALTEDEFPEVQAPRAGAGSWSELRRLWPFPVVTSDLFPDKVLPSSLIYPETTAEAIEVLARNLGGVPHLTREGALTVRPEFPPLSAAVDLTGTIADMDDHLSNQFANMVVVTGEKSGDKQLIGVAKISEGPLSISGPLKRRVRKVNDPLATTQDAVDAAARSWLRRLSGAQAKTVAITCLPTPALDPGDPIKATDPESGRVEVGYVSRLVYSLDPTDLMSVELTVPREEIPWG